MIKSILRCFALLLLLGVITSSLVHSPPIQASPLYGLTPTPTPLPTAVPPTPLPTTAPPTPKPPDDPDEPPDHQIEIELDCQLTCSVGDPSTSVEIRVQLVHDGSGWIAEGNISSAHNSRFEVPYPGEWKVYLLSQPQQATTAYMSNLTTVPQYWGAVQANSGTQFLPCPTTCPETIVPPATLPTAGGEQANKSFNSLFLLGLSSFILFLGGGLILFINRKPHIP